MESFSQLGLAEPLASALASFGFDCPTSVQTETIPILLSHRDAIIESETGTGKTFAYLAPAFQLVSVLERKASGEPGVIVAAPTQELAVQIGRESERLAKAASLSLKTVVLLGGTPLEKQAAKLKAKPEIVVGTLGRLADLVSLGTLRPASLKVLVLDEADRLFAKETETLAVALLKSAPSACTRVLVSATIPERLRRQMRPLLRDAVEICPAGETVMSGSIEHWCFYCDGRKRLDFARRFEAAIRPERCLLFLTMASRVEKAAMALAALGLPVGAIHAGMEKEARRVALERFASGELRYLLTSDLGARGLDIQGITHVLSLDLPEEPTIYKHRAGRTGRAGAKGVSIVLADGVELARASKIATKGGFVFRCKVLEEGKVLEPTTEEFFARAKASEEQRIAAKAASYEPEGGSDSRRKRATPWRSRSESSSAPPRASRDEKASPTRPGRSDAASHEPRRAGIVRGDKPRREIRDGRARDDRGGARQDARGARDGARGSATPRAGGREGDRQRREGPPRERPLGAARRFDERGGEGRRDARDGRIGGARGPARDGARGPARDGARGPARDNARISARGPARGSATPRTGGHEGDRQRRDGPRREGPQGSARRLDERGDKGRRETRDGGAPRTKRPPKV